MEVNSESFPIQDEPGAHGMLRIDNQRARSREAEPGSDRGISKSQRRDPVRRRKPQAGLSVDRAGSVPAAVLHAKPSGAGVAAAVPGEDDRFESGASDPADRPLPGPRHGPAHSLPAPSLSATLYPG